MSMASYDKENKDTLSHPAHADNASSIQSLIDTFTSQISECQAVSTAVRLNLLKQKEDLDLLARTQSKLHRSQQDLLAALVTWLQADAPTPADVVDGTVTSSRVNATKTTATFCVGMPDLTGTALRQYAAAILKLQGQEDELLPNDPLSEVGKTLGDEMQDPNKRRTRSRNTRQPVAAPEAIIPKSPAIPPPGRSSQQLTSIVHNLLSGANWRRAVDLVSHLRQLDKRKLNESDDPCAANSVLADRRAGPRRTKTEKSESPEAKPPDARVGELRQLLQTLKCERPTLFGRDDYLYITLLNDSVKEFPTIRCEILLPSMDLYQDREIRVDGSEDIQTVLDWASQQVLSLPGTANLGSEWDGDFSQFKIAPGAAGDYLATIKYIPLVTGGNLKEVENFRNTCKESKFYSQWFNGRNGMWKAEVYQKNKLNCAAFQRSLKQSGSYQKALVDTMQWLLVKCKQEGINTVCYKSKQDCCTLFLPEPGPAASEGKKRSRRQSSVPDTQNQCREDPAGIKKRKQ